MSAEGLCLTIQIDLTCYIGMPNDVGVSKYSIGIGLGLGTLLHAQRDNGLFYPDS
jgi:hypothetical protein